MIDLSFKPAWWLPHAHLQTVWPTLFRRAVKDLILTKERIELPDGDFVDLVWTGPSTGPIVILLHGLEGSIESSYIKGMLSALRYAGFRSVLMHFRSCSGELNRLPRSYHSGETEDVAAVVNILKQREPLTPLAAVGFSLGGNVLLKWLGETGKHNPLQAAVAISVPFELEKSVHKVNRGFSRIYQWYLLSALKKKMQKKFQKSCKHLRTLKEFDDTYTAPLHGFDNADDYYSRCSSRKFLPHITTPTLLLQAKDDPFMTLDLLPQLEELGPGIQLEITEAGGHVGFISGKFPWRPDYWLEKRVPAFLQGYM